MIAIPGREDAAAYVREGGTREVLAQTEWVLTNGLGGDAMGTALGAPTRRYHGLLVAALSPPVRREVMLHSIADSLVLEPGTEGEKRVDLTPFCFRGGVWAPRTLDSLVRFEKDVLCRWVFRTGEVELSKRVRLVHGRNAVAVSYAVSTGGKSVRLSLRPLVAMRDAHGLRSAPGAERPRAAGVSERGLTMVHGATRLELWAEGAAFQPDAQTWYGFEYPNERERGFDCWEDLESPGAFVCSSRGGDLAVTVTAWIGERPGDVLGDEARRRGTIRRASAVAGSALKPRMEWERGAIARLTAAADDFVVRRSTAHARIGESRGAHGCSVIAGYPWFTDWGRDSMISLPGLLLTTGRHGEALSVLTVWARHRRGGLIPNCFDEHTGAPRYNTADASLWFLHAACEYLRASGDRRGFAERLRGPCLEIIEAYAAGTDFGIGVDGDGLVRAGDERTQLTWMDAQRDGVVFTPRHGKPVEISALWHHALVSVAEAVEKDERRVARRFREMAERCAAGFAAFWDAERGCLFDVLHPPARPGGAWVPDRQLRPNQILAASLRHSPLKERQGRAVVQSVRSRLLTPMGLRTLDPADPAYRGRFTGPIAERDAAYHNGTVWPWLLGPFAEAVLRVGRFSPAARADARALLRPLAERLDGESVGQLPEVFDGDEPQRPGGCTAQAWSVAEVLRVLALACGNGSAG